MALGDGLHKHYQARAAEAERLTNTIARFEQDIASMQAKRDEIEAEQPALEADLIAYGITPVKFPDRVPVEVETPVKEVNG